MALGIHQAKSLMPALYNGDCLEVMRKLPSDSIDAIVTDPPAGISFMGTKWDGPKGGRDQWVAWLSSVMAECYRLTRPGGHALVWALPRTSHWTGMAIEDAGWEIRDRVTHIFGQGFPKGHDIGRAIDKAAGYERDVIGHRVNAHDIRAGDFGSGNSKTMVLNVYGGPKTLSADEWDGWNTALRPAAEDWWLCRKPLSEKTIVANVLAHGTGGINVGACRIGDEDRVNPTRGATNQVYNGFWGKEVEGRKVKGRWPANAAISHTDDCVAISTSEDIRLTGARCSNRNSDGLCMGHANSTYSPTIHRAKHGETEEVLAVTRYACVTECPVGQLEHQREGASRFIYSAKAPKRERPKLDDGTFHPTVKSIALMRWLVRMVTPNGGMVLDPFAGSGTTLEAALLEGMDCIGIESQKEYIPLIIQRLKRVKTQPAQNDDMVTTDN